MPAGAIYTTDREGLIGFWNQAAERIFGFTREQAIGQRAPFVPKERKEEARALRERVLGGETIASMELERCHADGRAMVVNGSAAPLRDADGRVSGSWSLNRGPAGTGAST